MVALCETRIRYSCLLVHLVRGDFAEGFYSHGVVDLYGVVDYSCQKKNEYAV